MTGQETVFCREESGESMETKCIVYEMAGIVFKNIYNRSIHVGEELTINHFVVEPDVKCDITNYIHIVDQVNYSRENLGGQTANAGAWSQYGHVIFFHPCGRDVARMTVSPDCTCATTYLEELDTSMHVLPICITGFLLQRYLLMKKQGFVMHGAAWRIQNVGCVFTGNSGVGKSTISRLVRESGMDAEQYSDDRFIMKIEEEGVLAYGNPFDCKIERNINAGVKIDALFFLHHGEENKVCGLKKGELLKRLVTVSLLPYGSGSDMKWAMGHLAKFAGQVKCYDLYFMKDVRVVKTLWEAVGGAPQPG